MGSAIVRFINNLFKTADELTVVMTVMAVVIVIFIVYLWLNRNRQP